MKILIVGGGARENAIAFKIATSPSFSDSDGKIFCIPGNAGIDKFAEPVAIKVNDIDSILRFAILKKIDFTIVGPELPLSSGIVNEFQKNKLLIFGPSKEAAEIESSKVFAKELMLKNNIPTAHHKSFSRSRKEEAVQYISTCSYPVVIKADGLASGKGVVIAESKEHAMNVIDDFIESRIFGDAGNEFIIEEYLEGEEISVFAITDGDNFVVLPFSQDHKRVGEGDTGKNTGGMGAIAPIAKYMTNEMTEKISSRIISPVLKAMNDAGREFKGCLYCGLMIVGNDPYVIEFNCRFGDPETQAVLPLIESDFLKLLIASANVIINDYELKINNLKSCCVVLASDGYPESYETGKKISGLDETVENVLVFHSGTKRDERVSVITDGGRVMSVVGLSETSLEEASRAAYRVVDKIIFENKYFRRDIGYRYMKYGKEILK